MRLTHIMRVWRESATLILAARGRAPAATSSSVPAPAIHEPGRHVSPPFDYNVLLLQRSEQSSFLPSGHVFPGGCVADSDFSDKWASLFRVAGVDFRKILSCVFPYEAVCRPPMLNTDYGSTLPNDVAFRICAIRETFEESGVLICTRRTGTGYKSVAGHGLTNEALSEWRRRVMNDDNQFMVMLEELNLLPDICSLHEWSNWLTPIRLQRHANKRFDTMFYVCCVNAEPATVHDEEEIVEAQWMNPAEILDKFSSKTMELLPPQVYELSRLRTFSQLDDLSSFAKKRRSMGCERWMNVGIRCTDGLLLVLPGDDLYPAEPDIDGILPPLTLPYSVKDAQANSSRQNRLILHDDGTLHAHCTITQKYNHVSPMAVTN